MNQTEYEEALRQEQERADLLMMDADTDALTGLLNRRGLDRRTKGRDWGWFVAADLDGFKAAQDKQGRGHTYGDAILVEFADFLVVNTRQRANRARDILAARTGGDEFTIWTETRSGALRIRNEIQRWSSKGGQVTSSAGTGNTIEAADNMCYVDKVSRRANR